MAKLNISSRDTHVKIPVIALLQNHLLKCFFHLDGPLGKFLAIIPIALIAAANQEIKQLEVMFQLMHEIIVTAPTYALCCGYIKDLMIMDVGNILNKGN